MNDAPDPGEPVLHGRLLVEVLVAVVAAPTPATAMQCMRRSAIVPASSFSGVSGVRDTMPGCMTAATVVADRWLRRL